MLFFLLPIFTAFFGLISFAGIGLVVMVALGLGGGLTAWLVAKHIPWKVVALFATVIFVGLLISTGVQIFRDNQRELAATQVQLAKEKVESQAQKLRADNYEAEHNAQVKRIEDLEQERTVIMEQDQQLQDQVRNMNLPQEFSHDAAKAVERLNTRANSLNRMLGAITAPGRANPGVNSAARHSHPSPTHAAPAHP